jgi:hypothetical protein
MHPHEQKSLPLTRCQPSGFENCAPEISMPVTGIPLGIPLDVTGDPFSAFSARHPSQTATCFSDILISPYQYLARFWLIASVA